MGSKGHLNLVFKPSRQFTNFLIVNSDRRPLITLEIFGWSIFINSAAFAGVNFRCLMIALINSARSDFAFASFGFSNPKSANTFPELTSYSIFSDLFLLMVFLRQLKQDISLEDNFKFIF